MKNAKDKAQELVNKFKPYMYPFGAGSAYLTGDREGNRVLEDARKCSIILINESISAFEVLDTTKMEYWQEVKKELSNTI